MRGYSYTHVFWDMNDWPIDNFENPREIFRSIEVTLEKEGYGGELSVSAFGEMSSNIEKEFCRAGIYVDDEVPENDFKRLETMLLAMVKRISNDYGRLSNLVVVSNISEDVFYFLKAMKSRGHNVVYALKGPDDSRRISQDRISEAGMRELICPNLLNGEDLQYLWENGRLIKW